MAFKINSNGVKIWSKRGYHKHKWLKIGLKNENARIFVVEFKKFVYLEGKTGLNTCKNEV